MHVSEFDYVFQGQMESSLQSIPIGNGDMGANVWMQDNALYLLLSKSDSFNEWCELLKLGLIKITADCGAFQNVKFTLSLYHGVLTIQSAQADFAVWMDENGCVVTCDSRTPICLTAQLVNYRDEPLQMPIETAGFCSAMPDDPSLYQSADICGQYGGHTAYQLHRNGWSCYQPSLDLQGLSGFAGKDPLLHRMFGFAVRAEGGTAVAGNGSAAVHTGKGSRHVLRAWSKTMQPATQEQFLNDLLAAQQDFSGLQQERLSHQKMWNAFWEKSYLYLSGSEEAQAVTRGYLYQRYMNRCAGKGAYPIKFNGSIFTVHPDPSGKQSYDYRKWGGLYWIQNTRLIYWNMLYSGDFDLMMPFFQTYFNMLPIARYRTKEYFGHEGALIPETTTFFGTYSNDNYGYNRKNRHKSYVDCDYIARHFNGQLEIAYMMLKYYAFTGNADFLHSMAVPFTTEVLTFFDQHFRGINGQFVLKNVSALETWQDCVNDTPNICGLMAICDFVINEEAAVGPDTPLAALCRRLQGELPPIPRQTIYGHEVFAPCELAIDKQLRNCEDPELYGVFPYDLFDCRHKDDEGFAVAQNTLLHKVPYEYQGWRQDGIFAAKLGLAKEAFGKISQAFQSKCPQCAFDAYWGPNYDWIPDQDHGSANSIALIQALVQSSQNEVAVLPAWQKELSVRFRLPVYGGRFLVLDYVAGQQPHIVYETGDPTPV